MLMDPIGIAAIEIALPNHQMHLDVMASRSRLNPEALFAQIGVWQKPVLNKNESINELALVAAHRLMHHQCLNPREIDVIIYASCGIQEKQLWSPAAKIQKEIKATNAFSLDIQNGCNSGNVGLEMAAQLLARDHDKQTALLITADALSSLVDYSDPKHVCIFNFSDAASAVLIKKNSSQKKWLSFVASTDASFADSLYRPIDQPYVWMNDDAKEDESLIKAYETRYVTMIQLALAKIDKSITDVSFIIMNQGDHKLINKLATKLCFPAHHIFRSHEQYGHLGGSDIFFGLKSILDQQLVRKGDLVVLASSAIGFSWGASVVEI